MLLVTTESVEDWSRALDEGSAEVREEAARFLSDAITHHEVRVCIAAYTALRKADRHTADGVLCQLLERMRRRAEGWGGSSVRWILLFLFLFGVTMGLTRNYTHDVRTMCAAFVVTVFIGSVLGDVGAKRAAQRELKVAIDLLSEQPSTDLALLLPDLRRIAAFQNGQQTAVRKEASQLVRRIETALREEGALPLPAEPDSLPENELPRPSSAKATEHLTPNA